jgi:hypothetical protein
MTGFYATSSLVLLFVLLPSVLHHATAHGQVDVSDEVGYFWHIADTHYDREYLENGDTAKRCTQPCGEEGCDRKASKMGDYNCDPPKAMVKSALDFMKNEKGNADFLVYTGDSPPHYAGIEYWEVSTPEMIMDTVLEVQGMLLDWANQTGVPVFPIMGNHDNHPANFLAPPDIPDARKWIDEYVQSWKDFGLPEEGMLLVTFNFVTICMFVMLTLI